MDSLLPQLVLREVQQLLAWSSTLWLRLKGTKPPILGPCCVKWLSKSVNAAVTSNAAGMPSGTVTPWQGLPVL
jgi:hypothetical protein